jgi:uncharacterized protein
LRDERVEVKKSLALEQIRELGGLVVALSGGVDSAVLLSLAVEALGSDRVLAITAVSASLATGELDDARAVAASLGVRHEELRTRELDNPAYRANQGDRCFHCRSEMFDLFQVLARQRGIPAVAYGAIGDDESDDRPGMRAAAERRVVAPLLDAGFSKDEVRQLAEEAGLTVRAKPASACLASRIPVGTEVTAERLDQVNRAETALRRLGLGQLRVRHHGEIARLELDQAGEKMMARPGTREEVVRVVREAGFRYVALDLEGYRTGSTNPESAGPEGLYRIGPARDGGQ